MGFMVCRGVLQGRALMSPYLPRNGASPSPFSEGGALFALGLIHANHGHEIRSFLLESLSNTSNEVRFDLGHNPSNIPTDLLETVPHVLTLPKPA